MSGVTALLIRPAQRHRAYSGTWHTLRVRQRVGVRKKYDPRNRCWAGRAQSDSKATWGTRCSAGPRGAVVCKHLVEWHSNTLN